MRRERARFTRDELISIWKGAVLGDSWELIARANGGRHSGSSCAMAFGNMLYSVGARPGAPRRYSRLMAEVAREMQANPDWRWEGSKHKERG